jgi:Site-specific recombinase XerD
MKQYRIREYHSKSHPHLKFVVNFKEGSKRARRFFETKTDAKTFALTKNIALENTGREGADFPSALRIMATAADEMLKPYDKNIMDAVEFYIPHLQARNRTCTFAELVAEFLPAKEADGLSAPYLTDLKCRLGQFSNSFGEKLVSEITCDEIDDWLRGLDVSPVTRNNSRRVLRTAFSFALARNYCIDNPAAKTAKAKDRGGIIGILTVAQTARLLESATPDVLPYFAIGLFAGLRRAEIERLDWSKIDFESGLIEVTAQNSKTAQRRLVTMQPNLRKWLLPLRKHKGNVTPSNCFRELFEQAREAAGIAEWPDNALRHSFASYHLAHFKNAASTALELGHHDSRITFAHYRELVRPKDAEKYWNLIPTAAGVSSKVVSISA